MAVKACRSCKAMAGEVHTPVGDGALLLCYLCAHDVTVHGTIVGEPGIGCACRRDEVYPARVLYEMDRDLALIRGEVPPAYVEAPTYIGRNNRAARAARVRASAAKALHGASEDASRVQPAEGVKPNPDRIDHIVLIGD